MTMLMKVSIHSLYPLCGKQYLYVLSISLQFSLWLCEVKIIMPILQRDRASSSYHGLSKGLQSLDYKDIFQCNTSSF